MNPLRSAFLPPIQGLAHVAMKWFSVVPGPAAGGAWRPPAVSMASAVTSAEADVAMEDWDLLFAAVRARLAHAAEAVPEGSWHDETLRLRRTVRDCEAALAQLHRSLVHARALVQPPALAPHRDRTLCEGWTELG